MQVKSKISKMPATTDSQMNPAYIQEILKQNEEYLKIISRLDMEGKLNECVHYQQLLHRNLVYIGIVGDVGSNQYNLPKPPIIAPLPSAVNAVDSLNNNPQISGRQQPLTAQNLQLPSTHVRHQQMQLSHNNVVQKQLVTNKVPPNSNPNYPPAYSQEVKYNIPPAVSYNSIPNHYYKPVDNSSRNHAFLQGFVPQSASNSHGYMSQAHSNYAANYDFSKVMPQGTSGSILSDATRSFLFSQNGSVNTYSHTNSNQNNYPHSSGTNKSNMQFQHLPSSQPQPSNIGAQFSRPNQGYSTGQLPVNYPVQRYAVQPPEYPVGSQYHNIRSLMGDPSFILNQYPYPPGQ